MLTSDDYILGPRRANTTSSRFFLSPVNKWQVSTSNQTPILCLPSTDRKGVALQNPTHDNSAVVQYFINLVIILLIPKDSVLNFMNNSEGVQTDLRNSPLVDLGWGPEICVFN